MELGFLKWIDHSAFTFGAAGMNVYIDPFNIRGGMPSADVIFITHSHFDHLSEKDISLIATGKTRFVAPIETASKLRGRDVLAVEPGNKYDIDGIRFSTVAAYNVKPERLQYHPRSNGWVGYVIDADGASVYHAGDTDSTPEMAEVVTDVALLPIGGKFVMTVDEAIPAASAIRAKAVAPMHYRTLLGEEGSRLAEEKFLKGVRNGVILKQVQEPRYSF